MTRREAPVSPPVVLTIAGSDSGGGAGIQADCKTIEACGGFGTTAITSVTAQNTQGVAGSHGLPIEDVDAQIEAVLDDFDVAAVKTGMLATREVVDLVVDHTPDLPNLVVDPVMVAASGDRLLAEAAETAYESLLAEATLVTPNADEATVLTDVAVEDGASAERAGRILVEEHGADAALVKGGHVPGDHVVDTLVAGPAVSDRPTTLDGRDVHDEATNGDDGRNEDGGTNDRRVTDENGGANGNGEVDGDGETTVTTFRHDRVATDATHGSGCTLSSAIATRLAHGDGLTAAVGAGVDLLARAVRYNVAVGQGPGVVHHLVELRNDASRGPTAELLQVMAARCRDELAQDRFPPAGLGLVAATPHADVAADVAAGTVHPGGRTEDHGTDREGGEVAGIAVRFGGNQPLASVLLAAREVDPGIRFGACVSADPQVRESHAEDVVSIDGVDLSAADAGPLDPADIDAIAGATAVPLVVSTTVSADENRSLAVALGETPQALLDRVASFEG